MPPERRRLAVTVALVVASACGDPLTRTSVPGDQQMAIFVVLDPDATQQLAMVQMSRTDPLQSVAVKVSDGSAVSSGSVSATTWTPQQSTSAEVKPCVALYGGAGYWWPTRCIPVTMTPVPGASYDVTVQAGGRPTASATTAVPGAFTVTAASFDPASARLHVTWTPSNGAYRYAVVLRDSAATCLLCDNALAFTTDTSLDIGLRTLGKNKRVEVIAMNRDLLDYLTTGTDNFMYPLPPAQNVTGGYGAVGAWVRRSRPLP
ncbi:MAG TPA: DUF4249 family protein [Gemmatimonadaceae bacterium]